MKQNPIAISKGIIHRFSLCGFGEILNPRNYLAAILLILVGSIARANDVEDCLEAIQGWRDSHEYIHLRATTLNPADNELQQVDAFKFTEGGTGNKFRMKLRSFIPEVYDIVVWTAGDGDTYAYFPDLNEVTSVVNSDVVDEYINLGIMDPSAVQAIRGLATSEDANEQLNGDWLLTFEFDVESLEEAGWLPAGYTTFSMTILIDDDGTPLQVTQIVDSQEFVTDIDIISFDQTTVLANRPSLPNDPLSLLVQDSFIELVEDVIVLLQ